MITLDSSKVARRRVLRKREGRDLLKGTGSGLYFLHTLLPDYI